MSSKKFYIKQHYRDWCIPKEAGSIFYNHPRLNNELYNPVRSGPWYGTEGMKLLKVKRIV